MLLHRRAGLKVRPLVRSKGNDRHNHQPDHQHGHHNHHDSNGNNSQHHNSKQGHKGHHHVENTSASGASGKGGGDKGGEDGVEEAAAPRGQTVIKDAMAEALALAKKATYAASHNAEVVKARRRSTDHRRSLDRHHHHGNHQDHSHR